MDSSPVPRIKSGSLKTYGRRYNRIMIVTATARTSLGVGLRRSFLFSAIASSTGCGSTPTGSWAQRSRPLAASFRISLADRDWSGWPAAVMNPRLTTNIWLIDQHLDMITKEGRSFEVAHGRKGGWRRKHMYINTNIIKTLFGLVILDIL